MCFKHRIAFTTNNKLPHNIIFFDFPAGDAQFSPNQKYVFLNIRIKHTHMPKNVFFWVVSNTFLPIKKNCKKIFFTVSGLGSIKHVRYGMSHFFENGSVVLGNNCC